MWEVVTTNVGMSSAVKIEFIFWAVFLRQISIVILWGDKNEEAFPNRDAILLEANIPCLPVRYSRASYFGFGRQFGHRGDLPGKLWPFIRGTTTLRYRLHARGECNDDGRDGYPGRLRA